MMSMKEIMYWCDRYNNEYRYTRPVVDSLYNWVKRQRAAIREMFS